MSAKRTQSHAGARASRGHGATPEAQRAEALGLLLAGYSTDGAAEKIGIDGSTVRRWLADDPDFAAQYQAGLAEIQAATTRQIIAAKGVAVQTLVVQARAGDVAAARALLQHGEPQKVSAIAIAGSTSTAAPPRSEAEARAELWGLLAELVAECRRQDPDRLLALLADVGARS